MAVIDEYGYIPHPHQVDASVSRIHLLRDPIGTYAPDEAVSFDDIADVPWVFEPAGVTARRRPRGGCAAPRR